MNSIHTYKDHYSNVSNDYDSLYHINNKSYENWILSIIIKELNISSSSIVVDIGGGTGSFSKKIYDNANLIFPILCVDNNDDMLKVASSYNGVITQCLDAQHFACQSNQKFDAILLKEMIHHIPKNEIQKLYSNLKNLLNDNGICLTITRPKNVVYPIFKAAHKVWSDQQPLKEELLEYITKSGLNVICKSINIDIKMSKDDWFQIIRSRFWSTFSHFNDNELEEGIKELKISLANKEDVSYTEELILFIAKN